MLTRVCGLQSVGKYNQVPHVDVQHPNLVLLLPFTSNTTDIISSTAATTNHGSTVLSSGQTKIGSQSLRLANASITQGSSTNQSGGQYLLYPSISTSSYTNGITLAAWIYLPTGSTHNDWAPWFSLWNGTGGQDYLMMGLQNSKVWVGACNADSTPGTVSLSTSTWYHIVWKLPYNTTTGMGWYLNGTAQTAPTNNAYLKSAYTYGNFGIGVEFQWNAWFYLDAYISDFRMYNKLLTGSEVTAIYNNTTPGNIYI
jgi:hypothetical protein